MALNLVRQDHSKHTHTHTLTQAPAHTIDYTQSTTLTHVKQSTGSGLNNGGNPAAPEGKTWWIYCLLSL